MNALLTDETTVLGGRVRLIQPCHGYRAGMDAGLLAAAVQVQPGARVLELGCGVGAALLSAAVRNPGAHLLGLERDPQALELAQQNITLNGLNDRVSVRGFDIAMGWKALGETGFDAAMCNPPYYDDPNALRAPHPTRQGAYLADDGLDVWMAFTLKALKSKGVLSIIHRAERLADILKPCTAVCGDIRILPIVPFAHHPAKRVIVTGRKSAKGALKLLPPLVLHTAQSHHTEQADAILRGLSALNL